MSSLTHFDSQGQAHMVDIAAKAPTHRTAIASGRIDMLPATLALVASGTCQEGRRAGHCPHRRHPGCQAHKRTDSAVPPHRADARVAVEFTVVVPETPERGCPRGNVQATAETVGPTGVEMEALTAVQVALLTIYDMCKAVDRGMTITGVRLREKHGGKSGSFVAGK
jgi:cyclic pyranopterin phosphate synthase